MRPGSIHDAGTGFLEPISYNGMPCSTLMGGRKLVLPQLNVPGFTDSQLEAFPFLRSRWGNGLRVQCGRGKGAGDRG